MDEAFLKSALQSPDPFVVDDTTLALPSATTSKPNGKVNSNDRSLRVHQQVQLTLARKARKTLSNGSVHLQRSKAGSFDYSEGQLPSMKANGLGLSNRSLSTKPCRRVEVTPPPSPEAHQQRLLFGTHRMGMYTVPGPAQLNRVMLDRSLSSDFHHRYAFSDGPRYIRPHKSSASHRQRSFRQVALPQPVFEDEVFLPNVEKANSSRWSQKQALSKQEHHSVALGLNGPAPPENGSAWLSRVRTSTNALRRVNSYPPSATSMEVDTARPEVELLVQAGNAVTLKSENRGAEMTIEKAVNLLSQDNEETLVCAASFIQNQCFKSADAKKMVYYLRGIGKLMRLLGPDSEEEVQRAAAGALRNLVFQSNENKMEVKENNGVSTVLRALKSSRDVETRRQLTGLLWNLSSHDLLKEHLSVDGLLVLTQSVLVPCSGLSEGENPKDELLADADVFHNATGCLRNLSSAGPNGRKAMRECENLIDSLVYYIRGSIADYKTDDKTTENCACILHNLSYQIEEELPRRYAEELRQSKLSVAPKAKPVSCFSNRTAKITELERHCPLLEEKSNPCGVEWLWSAITVRMYLSLIARSVRHHTQEAALGALQNITAGHGPVTESLCFTIVQRENGLQHIKRTLEEGDSEVRRTAVSLIRNLSRHKELHSEIVAHVLAELVSVLPNNDRGTDLPTEVTTCLCHILLNLSQNHTESVKAVVNNGALAKIINISNKDNGYGPSRAGQAACALLHSMWKHTDLHSLYKKCGFRKTDFINSRTTKAVNSSRD